MKKIKMTAIMILALCLMVLAGSVAEGGVHLEIDGQNVDIITLKQFQKYSITVVSDDNASYELNVQLLSLLGSFTHDRTEAIAGDLATVTKYGTRAFDVTAAGSGIEAGVHFVFSYEPNTPGINRLDLVDRSQMIPVIIDSIDITILPFSGPMGTAWTYQGRLMDANYPADGLYDFKFKLYNCSDPCWGVQLGDTVDMNGLDVIDGHFVVELDFGSDVFDGNAVWLETSVVRSPLGSDPAALRPLIEITPVPYALQTRGMFVDSTGNVGIGIEPGSIEKLYVANDSNDFGSIAMAIHGEAKGVGTGANFGIVGTATDAIGYNVGVKGQAYGSGLNWGLHAEATDGAVNYGVLGRAYDGITNYGVYGSANGGTTNWAGYFAGDVYVSGNAGIGTESPVAKLDVEGDGTNTPLELDAKGMSDYGRAIRAINTGMADGTNLNFNIGKSDNLGQTGEITYYHAGVADPNNMLSLGLWGAGKILNIKYDGNVGIGITNPTEKVEVSGNVKVNGMGNGVIFPDGTKQTTAVSGGDMDWTVSGNNMYSSVSGNVGIGTTSPTTKLDVEGNGTNTPLEVDAKGMSNNARAFRIKNTGMVDGTNLNFNIGKADVLGQTGEITYYHAGDDNPDNMLSLGLWGPGKILNMTYEGNVGIGTANPNDKLTVVTSKVRGTAVRGEAINIGGLKNYGGYFTAAGDNGRGVYGYASGINGKGLEGNAPGDNGVGIYAKGGPQGYAAVFQGNVIIKAHSSGNIILELGEGLDYAEGFDVSAAEKIEAGSVLVIDADNPGKLALSNRSYDTKVAGIVAGAKGLGSGVRLGAGQFDYDVALAGRVYCKVDAIEEAVQAGDLLTTSTTPGYAMKAVDYARRHGAILGKAMESIEKGQKGKILVLVTLQ